MSPADDASTLALTMVRVETKLDVVLGGHVDHESRIRRLERTVWVATGAAAVLGGMTGTIASNLVR